MKYLESMTRTLPCGWLQAAGDSKRKDSKRFGWTATALALRYQKFDGFIDDHQQAPEAMKLHKRVSAMLRDYYNHPPTRLGKLLAERRHQHQLIECPYCGRPFVPDTLDHFLPKDDWAEFSIFPNNLVPQCRPCASIKSTHYFCDEQKSALFLHPVYSDVLSRTYFHIDVAVTARARVTYAPRFSLDRAASDDEIARLKRHIRQLQIVPRMVRYCERQYMHWDKKLGDKAFDIDSSFKVRLDECRDPLRAENWEIAFYQGMLACDDAMGLLRRAAGRNVPAAAPPAPDLTPVALA